MSRMAGTSRASDASGSEAVAALFGAAHDCFLACRTSLTVDARSMVDVAVEVLDAVIAGTRAIETREPTPIGATRHVAGLGRPEAAPPEVGAAIDELVDVLGRNETSLPWTRTVGYLDVLSAHYLDNYGFVQLVGPSDVSLVRHESVRVGLGLWGPDLDYPEHHHPAEELYLVMAGEPDFSIDGGPFVRAAVGSGVHMAPHRVHALRFGATPTLVLYVWTGDVVTDAVLADTGADAP